jgi:hypothetical protein
MAGECSARAGAAGFTVKELVERLQELLPHSVQSGHGIARRRKVLGI